MAASAFPLPQLTLAPRAHDASSQSTNWSGYAVTGASGSVSNAKGSWIVPAIVGTCTSTNQFSSFWVGIDGFSSGTVEQTGTDSDCQNGAPTYFAWFEFFPHPSFIISGLTISPGDHISAQSSFNGRSFVVTITDTTTGASFSTSSRVKSAQRSSAEWIAEAPSSSGGILPLADFGTVSYGTDNTGIAMTCFATIGGTTAAIGAFGSSIQQITMVSNSGATKAQPSALSSDGTSFSVTWQSSGP
jgi:peptidase A4-like protein